MLTFIFFLVGLFSGQGKPVGKVVNGKIQLYEEERHPHHLSRHPFHLHSNSYQHVPLQQTVMHPSSKLLSTSRWSLFSQSNKEDGSYAQWIIHVKGPITSRWKEDMNAHLHPHKLGHYFPHNSFLIYGPNTSDFIEHLHNSPGFVGLNEFSSDLKVHSTLADSQFSEKKELVVHLVSSVAPSSMSHNEQLLTAWQNEMQGSQTSVQTISPHILEIGAEASHVPQVVEWLSQRPEVHWIEPKPKFTLMNKWSSTIIQTDDNYTVVWNNGLRGEGQIVAVGDTGVDYDSCFFYDPNVPIPMNKVDFNHRKIVTYVPKGDSKDDVDGHGTHVSGSLLGEVLNANSSDALKNLSQYNGMAPKAKLAFYDFKKSNTDSLVVPSSLYKDYYSPSQTNAHAYITSNSWGSPESGYYDYTCLDTDNYVHDNPDFLPVFAAGNYGDKGFFSISSPGVAKNVLTVGSSKSSSASFEEQGLETGVMITSPADLSGTYQVVPAQFGSKYSTASIPPNTEVVPAEPYNACGSIQNSAQLRGKIALVKRGTCLFTDKAKTIQATGAIVMLVSQQDDTAPTVMGGEEKSITIPCGMIAKSVADSIVSQVPVIATTPVYYASPDLTESNLADFSSRGPTADGRLKPDILTPGQMIMSVRSDGNINSFNCNTSDLLAMQGTSMSTPIAAGAAALVRQYYTDGYYPTGEPIQSDGFKPSAALIKASLIASAVSIGGTVDSEDKTSVITVTPAPSIFQGYGRVQLDNVLRFPNSNKTNLFIVDGKNIATEGIDSYCFKVYSATIPTSPTSSQNIASLRATLVWTDPPATTSQGVLLINNLDLFVVNTRTSELYVGNGDFGKFTDDQGLHTPWDILNNVEQVTIKSTEFGGYNDTIFSVHVRGTNVPENQSYALVITGNFENISLGNCGGAILCPNNCGSSLGHGTCGEHGLCNCVADRTSADCSQQSRAMIPSTTDNIYFTSQGSVDSWGWQFYHFDITANNSDSYPDGVEIYMKRTSDVGDPDFYVNINEFPTLSNYTYAAVACEPCGKQSTIIIPKSALALGRYRIGVYGYCCDNSTFELYIQQPPPASSTNWLVIIFTVTLIAVIVAAVYCGIRWYKNYQRNSVGNGLNFQPLVEDRPIPPGVELSTSGHDPSRASTIPVAIPLSYAPGMDPSQRRPVVEGIRLSNPSINNSPLPNRLVPPTDVP